MSPLKICHLADVHLGYRRFSRLNKQGYNQREADVSAGFQEALQLAAQQQPQLTIIAGDLFHAVRPSNAVIHFCLKLLKSYTLKTNSPVLIVAGNHETPRRSDTGSVLQILASIDQVYVVDQEYQRLHFRALDLAVDCVPHAALAKLDWRTIRSDANAKFNILVSHGQLKGAPGSEGGGYQIDLADIKTTDWDYIALGHVHTQLQFGNNCYYSGSTDFTSNNIWAEANEAKSILMLALPAVNVSRLKLSSVRPVINLPIIDAANLTAEELQTKLEHNLTSIAGGIEGKIIRQKISTLDRHIYRAVDQKLIKRWRLAALHYFIDPEFKSQNVVAIQIGERKKTILSGLIDFCQQQDLAKEESAAIIDSLTGYLHKVEQRDEAN